MKQMLGLPEYITEEGTQNLTESAVFRGDFSSITPSSKGRGVYMIRSMPMVLAPDKLPSF